MKISQLAKTAILILSLTGLAACSSTGEEAQEPEEREYSSEEAGSRHLVG